MAGNNGANNNTPGRGDDFMPDEIHEVNDPMSLAKITEQLINNTLPTKDIIVHECKFPEFEDYYCGQQMAIFLEALSRTSVARCVTFCFIRPSYVEKLREVVCFPKTGLEELGFEDQRMKYSDVEPLFKTMKTPENKLERLRLIYTGNGTDEYVDGISDLIHKQPMINGLVIGEMSDVQIERTLAILRENLTIVDCHLLKGWNNDLYRDDELYEIFERNYYLQKQWQDDLPTTVSELKTLLSSIIDITVRQYFPDLPSEITTIICNYFI